MKKKKENSQKNILFFLIGFLLLGGLFLTTIFIQNSQDIRQYAADPQPVGPAGTWKLLFNDEFDGTTIDTNKWSLNWFQEGGVMNDVGTYAANASVQNGNLVLTLISDSEGALIHTDYSAGRYQAKVGDYVEGRVYFPGVGTDIYNWPAFWISGQNWPEAGEHDIAEGLGELTINYHSPSGAHNHGTVPGTWSNDFHIYGIHRQADKADVYWDGTLVKSYPTDDNGQPEEIIINVGSGYGSTMYGTDSQLKVDYVRAWEKVSDETPSGQNVSPTYNCIGSCPTVEPTPEPTTEAEEPLPTDEEGELQPTEDPCIETQANGNVSVQTWGHEHEQRDNGDISNFVKLLLEFLIELLRLISQLLGGTPIDKMPTPGTPTPTAGDGTPVPTTNPCITASPNPTASAPTTPPVNSNDVQPAVDFARPDGGQWQIAFHDEFDGTGGTEADAMSGANFKDKTVGGGALPGNPGLNPRKWNMGWQTGPTTVDGLGMVTTATTGMCPNGCTENDWYGVESLVFPGDGALHMRSQENEGTAPNFERGTTSTSKNEMGMITTAGLMALNPGKTDHGNVPDDRFVDGPLILEWKATNTYVVDWPAFWMANAGYFGNAGSEWPGGTAFQEEIDLVEPIFRMHVASEFQSGIDPIPDGWDRNATLTFTWFFDTDKITLWVTDDNGNQVKQIDLPNGEVSAEMIEAQWRLPQYLFIQQKNLQETAGYGDMTLEYVRMWN